MTITEARSIIAQSRLTQAPTEALDMHSPSPQGPGLEGGKERVSFGDLISTSVNDVNATLKNAEALGAAFLREDPGADLVQTMVAANKAQVSFRAMVEVRNQLIQAYKDVANMPI